ncbi:MAG: AsmA family protein, partial [Candidatus Omnitrophica bacterium]|nr:AsmA family protein [Candidatus Omnitrophota bacterium]
FAGYYKSQGVSISGGTIDALLDIGLKDDTISLHADTNANGLIFSKGDFQYILNSAISLDFKYSLKDRQFTYSGNARLLQCGISGLASVGEIDKISGDVRFNNAGLSSDKINAVISGIPLEAKASLSDFKNPLFNIDTSILSLSVLQEALKDKFKIEIPASIIGEGKLSLTIESRIPKHLPPLINCRLDVSRGKIALNKLKYSFEGLAGRFEFTADQLKWSGVNFNYQGIPYNTNGTLIDFKAPRIEFVLSSRGLSMESALSLKGKLINIVKAKGRYLNSEFIFSGNLDISNPGRLQADISGKLNIDLKDTKEMFKKLQKQIEQVDPKGALAVSFNLDGDINDFKSCAIQANFSSPSVMAYGLKFQDLLLHYRQENALVELPLIDLSLYDGKIEGSAAMNMSTNRLPYQISLSMGGVNIGKLKMDTPVKNKDIAGTMDVEVKLNGYSNDLSKLSGAGKILISEGKLWELDLFKGMGKLIFAKEFSNIVFHEGSCGFVVQNKSIFTDNLKLKSNLVELDGTTSIGFDGSLDATIKLHVLDNAIPLKETYKDVITAIIGSVDAVGIININGTLKEPVYKFQPAVVDIINGLKDAIFDSILKK